MMGRYAGIMIAAAILDLILGDPMHWPHPVRAIGWLIIKVEIVMEKLFGLERATGKQAESGSVPVREIQRRRERLAGTLLMLLVVVLALGFLWLALAIAGYLHPYVRRLLEICLCYQMLAAKSLKNESMKVFNALKERDLEQARYAVSMIVGRDTNRLTEEGIVKATVETIAENTSDGVIAPLFYMALFGVWGAVFYKTVNTMDSMIGYQNEKYQYFGTAAAKLDDLCNFIPSRLAAVLMIMSSFFLGYHPWQAYRIFIRDRGNHKSPNSAQTEAVCAGALQIQLAGNAYYFGVLHEKPTIGDATRAVEFVDIEKANRLLYGTFFFCLCILIWI